MKVRVQVSVDGVRCCGFCESILGQIDRSKIESLASPGLEAVEIGDACRRCVYIVVVVVQRKRREDSSRTRLLNDSTFRPRDFIVCFTMGFTDV